MAFLDDQNKQAQDAQTAGQQQGQPLQQNAPNVSSGGGGSDVGSGVSTAGVGAGGGGGWTNIQAYLNANQGDQGSAKNLTDATSKQFGQDQSNMQGQSQKTLADAKGYVDQANVSPDQANQWITGAQGAYNWDGTTGQPQAYTDYVNKAKTALNGQYQGPSSFAYSLDPQSQNYGSALSNDGAFQNLMTNLYSQKAGAPLTSGQAALQGQFDANNPNLASARQQGQAQYGDLQKSRDQLNTDTTNSLANNQTDYVNNQNKLRSYLGDQAGAYTDKIAKDDADARTAYGTDYTTTPANVSFPGSGGFGGMNQLQSYVDNSAIYRGWKSGDPHLQNYGQTFSTYQPALNNFYSAEDQKYANADDQDKKAFNSIQDFLGNKDNLQAQGFKVRG